MIRAAAIVLVVALVLLPGSLAAGGVPSAPILYVQGLQCPAHKSCSGSANYDRIREIPRVGFPSRALSNGTFSDSQPAWSPNHEQIAFVRESHNGLSYAIWVMNANGSDARAVTHGNVVDAEPSWSPDGKTIVFRGPSADGRSFDLYTVGVNRAGQKRLTSNADNVTATNPDWSPNGKLIVFQRMKSGSGAGSGIYTIRSDGTGLKRLAIGGQQPVWSPNGERIAFVSSDSTAPGLNEIFVMNATGTGKKRLTRGAESTSPSWSPSGSQLVLLRGSQITLIHATGTGIKQLTKPLHGLAFVDTPDW
jgi:Tol biopolymer transport system component